MGIILFGAGASYGSEKVTPYPPPLSIGLFDELQKYYPKAWGAIPDSDKSKFVPNFEIGMKEIWENRPNIAPILMRCLADYFARFRPKSGNTYTRFLEHLDAHGALEGSHFSTLNYECLLEYAGRDYGFSEIGYSSKEPTSSVALSVWKIHGSCNFIPGGIRGGANGISYSAPGVSWNGPLHIVDISAVGPFVARNAFYPAMAVFMQGKPVRSHPSAILQLQQWWNEALMAADSVGIIGVGVNEDDNHIWDSLSNTSASIVVIGDRTKYKEWKSKKRIGKKTIIVGERFAEGLEKFAKEYAGT